MGVPNNPCTILLTAAYKLGISIAGSILCSFFIIPACPAAVFAAATALCATDAPKKETCKTYLILSLVLFNAFWIAGIREFERQYPSFIS